MKWSELACFLSILVESTKKNRPAMFHKLCMTDYTQAYIFSHACESNLKSHVSENYKRFRNKPITNDTLFIIMGPIVQKVQCSYLIRNYILIHIAHKTLPF